MASNRAGALQALPGVEDEVYLYVLKRVGLALITLVLLSLIIFLACSVLPGNPGREVLGNTASQRDVNIFNSHLGLNHPLWTRYWDWISKFVRGNMGNSFEYGTPVSSFLGDATAHSLRLAAVAFVIVVPLSVSAGVFAALHRDSFLDRMVTTVGTSLATVPEFASGAVLIAVVGIELKWLPVSAEPPPPAGLLTEIHYLILPAIPLVLVLFGYIARMARAGTIEALDSDYTRTATLKGLARLTVIRRHVLRNSLLPTITVIATQLGYLIGGLVVVEALFNYPGIGRLIFNAATFHDFPMLEAGAIVMGLIYTSAILVADVFFAFLNPRIRLGSRD